MKKLFPKSKIEDILYRPMIFNNQMTLMVDDYYEEEGKLVASGKRRSYPFNLDDKDFLFKFGTFLLSKVNRNHVKELILEVEKFTTFSCGDKTCKCTSHHEGYITVSDVEQALYDLATVENIGKKYVVTIEEIEE